MRGSILRRVAATLLRLGSRGTMLAVGIVAAVLVCTSVGKERALDDWVVGLIAAGRGEDVGLSRSGGDCFRFTDGAEAASRELMDAGNMLPWWSEPKLHVAFFRPLAAATHWLDERLWPQSAAAMHGQSLLWFLALLGAVALVYRRLVGSWSAAGLAFALYALDDAHGLTVGWLSNRNALIAGTAGCLSLYFHDRWRRARHPTHWLAWLTFILAWCAGELAIGALAYLIAYAVFVDPASRRARCLSLVPYLFVTVFWRSAWSLAGYGVAGSGGYVDPLRDPLAYMLQSPSKWLSLLQGQWGIIPSELVYLGDERLRGLWLATGALTVVACAALTWPFIREQRGRFWAMGMALSLLPLASAFPNDRLLLFVGLGAMALLAQVLEALLRELSRGGAARPVRTWRRALGGALFVIHGVLAPLLLPLRAAQLRIFARAEGSALDAQLSAAEAVGRTVVIVSAPSLLLANYAQARRALLRLPRPRHLLVLAATDSAVRVERSAESELTLTPRLGFLHTDLERHYRAPSHPLSVGAKVELSTITAEISSSTTDGRPQSVRFQLTRPVSEYVFLSWSGQAFGRWELPKQGAGAVLPQAVWGAAVAPFPKTVRRP